MSANREKYQEFATLLEELCDYTTFAGLDASQLRQRVNLAQQFFRDQIVPLTVEGPQDQSYRTEISKQLRLLEVDVMFFKGARQSSTAQARLIIIGDRLKTLIRYCEAVLGS
ncbi:MAG: heterocyst frequency control protein PatD [Cyanomargarita calcarea GSE-NOS-MK-12-04C]|jgi:hypothetical protein|uniref:Heterocyst frequency control protein PatD n=1 Tax=Cyanomargarita calcarea GSE-NOS-MK-12-04C TaxID=2839659 RepID=A0A951UR69_9CYAN|nr:heterocyst frequency control protein PatD [Cyanomargarita calcarea GSE-NOS-MK-12-04C]